jgi:hypothetical protein
MASINKHITKHIIIMILFYDFLSFPLPGKKLYSTEENFAKLGAFVLGPDEKPKRESSHKLPFTNPKLNLSRGEMKQ